MKNIPIARILPLADIVISRDAETVLHGLGPATELNAPAGKAIEFMNKLS
jgi:hypothetical protein